MVNKMEYLFDYVNKTLLGASVILICYFLAFIFIHGKNYYIDMLRDSKETVFKTAFFVAVFIIMVDISYMLGNMLIQIINLW